MRNAKALPKIVSPDEWQASRERLLVKDKTLYWTFTGLMAAFMLMASIPDVLQLPQAVAIFTHLGYPTYLLPFIGVAKILGVVAVLIPGFGRLKEWAYAGLVFDLIGALYSHLSVNDPPSAWGFPVIGLLLVTGSYFFYRRALVVQRIVAAGE
jgi:hypothetical protein